MTQNPSPTPRPRIPQFHAVPGKSRRDGWTPPKQAEFIGELAETRSVSEAARRVGMTRETAYRLRRRKWSSSFCKAWDAAMGRPPIHFKPATPGAGLRAKHLRRLGLSVVAFAKPNPSEPDANGPTTEPKVTLDELKWRVESGIWKVMLHRGRYIGVRRKPDDSALLQILSRTNSASLRCLPQRRES